MTSIADKVKHLLPESHVLSAPVYEVCDEDLSKEDLESCLQYCRSRKARLLVWDTHLNSSRWFEEYSGRKATYTEELLIYTIYLNPSLIACLRSRHNISSLKSRQVDKVDVKQFHINPRGYYKNLNDPNFTSTEVQELFCVKVQERNADDTQFFVFTNPDQIMVGFVAIKTNELKASCTLYSISDGHSSEDHAAMICTVLITLFSRSITSCTFEIQSSNPYFENLIKQCGGILVESIIHHNFWFSTEEIMNDMANSEIPQNIPFLTGNELVNIEKVLNTSSISTHNEYGPYCERYLEKSLGCLKALLVSSGTSALELCSLALNLGAGDEVIMPSYTFVSTANAFVVHGATPVFIDIRKDTLNIDEALIESAITEKTKAIVVVHYAGVSCEMDAIMKVARKYNLYVIEDNAHGVYGKYKEKYLGTIGHLSALSFHYTKNISCGEGGAVLINDYKLISACLIAWEKGTNRHDFMLGKVNKYSWVGKGSSFILSEISACLLAAQVIYFKIYFRSDIYF